MIDLFFFNGETQRKGEAQREAERSEAYPFYGFLPASPPQRLSVDIFLSHKKKPRPKKGRG
jgi:hypothetical protein